MRCLQGIQDHTLQLQMTRLEYQQTPEGATQRLQWLPAAITEMKQLSAFGFIFWNSFLSRSDIDLQQNGKYFPGINKLALLELMFLNNKSLSDMPRSCRGPSPTLNRRPLPHLAALYVMFTGATTGRSHGSTWLWAAGFMQVLPGSQSALQGPHTHDSVSVFSGCKGPTLMAVWVCSVAARAPHSLSVSVFKAVALSSSQVPLLLLLLQNKRFPGITLYSCSLFVYLSGEPLDTMKKQFF